MGHMLRGVKFKIAKHEMVLIEATL